MSADEHDWYRERSREMPMVCPICSARAISIAHSFILLIRAV